MMNIQVHYQCLGTKLNFMEMNFKNLKSNSKISNLMKSFNTILPTFKKQDKELWLISVFQDRLKLKIQEISCS